MTCHNLPIRTIRKGEIFLGKSNADMINKAIGTHFHDYKRCGVEMSDFGVDGVLSWFVFMNGEIHGYGETDWLWKNTISEDGNTIKEIFVPKNKSALYDQRSKKGFYPYRYAFMLDPCESGNRYLCKYMGAFRIKRILSDDLTVTEYEKVFDDAKVNYYADAGYNEIIDSKDKFLVGADRYKVSINQMGFSKDTLELLQKFNILTAGDVLELGFEMGTRLGDEIVSCLQKVFN